MSERQPVLSALEVAEFLDQVFPQVRGEFEIEEIAPMRARVRLLVTENHLRPGGTISGPAMFSLADCSFYVATLAMIGRQALTVTTNLSINFMRKPTPVDMVCEARILKLGRSLAVGDTTLYSIDQPAPVAHATVTYAIPPERSAS
ncbi:MAG: PaaI family thioesterase [Pseudomonadota bacterium]